VIVSVGGFFTTAGLECGPVIAAPPKELVLRCRSYLARLERTRSRTRPAANSNAISRRRPNEERFQKVKEDTEKWCSFPTAEEYVARPTSTICRGLYQEGRRDRTAGEDVKDKMRANREPRGLARDASCEH